MLTSPNRAEPEPPTMTVEQAAEYLGVSRAMAYAEAQRYRTTSGAAGLPNLKFGGRVLVITCLLTEMLRGHPPESQDAQLTSSAGIDTF